jgi:hypothetical protein
VIVGKERDRVGGRQIKEGALAERRKLVEDVGGCFLAAARLSNEQSGAKVRSYASDLASQLRDRWTGAVEPGS